jgi:hypothetical protein
MSSGVFFVRVAKSGRLIYLPLLRYADSKKTGKSRAEARKNNFLENAKLLL